MKKHKVLILGSSCWVAHYLIKNLLDNDFEVIGISNKNKPKHAIENYSIDMSNSQYLNKIKEINPNIIVNMTHSKDFEMALELHKDITLFTKEKDILYVYMSSSNACDGTLNRAAVESDKANGSSEYGRYKAACENHLTLGNSKFCIIRFPATHGFAPNRIARTEEFLSKLKNEDKVKLPTGITQNRPFVGHLSLMICQLIKDRQQGIFHLGTKDESDEKEFLTKLALGFGYSLDDLEAGDEYNHHMSVTPKKIYDLYGDRFSFEEQDTIRELVKSPELAKYIAKNN
jgi:dTDP-4-dehydrorhamnose reductase